MARITIEDCLPYVENRFELVLIAAKRARQIARGSNPMVAAEHDKPTVIALREIGEGLMNKRTVEAIDAKEQEDILLEPFNTTDAAAS